MFELVVGFKPTRISQWFCGPPLSLTQAYQHIMRKMEGSNLRGFYTGHSLANWPDYHSSNLPIWIPIRQRTKTKNPESFFPGFSICNIFFNLNMTIEGHPGFNLWLKIEGTINPTNII